MATFKIKDLFGEEITLQPRVELYSVTDFMGKEMPRGSRKAPESPAMRITNIITDSGLTEKGKGKASG